MKQKRKFGRKLLSFLLTLAMVVGLMPGMGLTAYAADEVSENISLVASRSARLSTITGTHYSVSSEDYEASETGMNVNSYSALTINARKGETITKVVLTYEWDSNKSSLYASSGTFDGNATISDINAQQVTISSSNTAGVEVSAVTVYFAGDLNNPTVTLTGGANAKSSGGLLTQSYLPGAMDTVTYTALTGAAFPEFETFTRSGVTVERTSDTVVTISGTPTANTVITVPDAESSSKIVTWDSSIINDSARSINLNNSYSDTANGITLTKSGSGDVSLYNGELSIYGDAALNFTTATGKFTNIEIETSTIYDGGNWTTVGNTLKWNGTPSDSVSLSGSLFLGGVSSINFVIEMPTVTVIAGDNMTKTTESGDESQSNLFGAIRDVVYTADDGYYFPEDYSVAAVNGISVTRDSFTQITVSGTPTADATITLTAPTAKTTPAAPTAAAAVDCTTSDNNDGKLTGVTTAMEYKKSDAESWTVGTGSDITGLVPGTYYVRVKATDTSLASDNQQLTIKAFEQKETATVTKAPTAKTLIYNNSAQELVTAGEATGGEMQYALGTKDAATEEYTASIPTATEAGTYYVWYKACGDANHNDSEPNSVSVTIGETETVTTPTFTPVEGTYTEAQSVTITCATEGATIHYTTDGSAPTSSSTTYSSAISVGETTTIKAIAVKEGMTDSEVAAATYTINIPKEKVATPAFLPEAGTYTEAQNVTITCATEGATIHYTTDGNEPTSSSTIYNSAISVGETTTIKAIAVKDGMTSSDVASATYTINIPKEKVATPTFTPVEGTYTEAQSVTISCATEGATIYYTTDGNEPTSSSTTYNSAISVGETTTIKAIAVKDGMTDSSVASATYTISEKPEPGTVATPTFSPEGGTYSDPQMVSINSETSGATIYYTTDGNDPTTESATFSSEITVTETTTIKAIAVKEGMTDSSVASVTYTISEEPEPGPEPEPSPEPSPEPEPSEDTKVDVRGLSDGDITDDLRAKGYDSVESIESALQTALSIETEEKKANSELVDAKLIISTDGWETWQEATLENFPEGGIDTILPYPDGTNGNEYSFSVAHMIGAGDRAGEIETPSTINTASGISVHFNGLSPVMITWTKNSSPSKDESKSEEKAHTHHFVWETVEATEESDGEFRYVCDICGGVQTRVPITAYYVFNKNTTEKIRKAGQGATVKIETSRWISFHKMVMQALAERPDVSLEVSFLDGEYKGNRVSFTIPAGTDTISLLDENGFSGFLYLAGKFGTAN